MLGLTADQMAASAAVVTAIGTGAGSLLGLYFNQIKREHSLELGAVKVECKRQSDSLEQAWKKIDDIREKSWRRDEQKEFRDEVKTDMDKLATRLETAIDKAVVLLREDIKGHANG